jgi:hypothetical protein
MGQGRPPTSYSGSTGNENCPWGRAEVSGGYEIQENNMIETPQIIQTQALAAAVIRLTVARSEMMKVFGPAVGELMAALASQGVESLTDP